MRSRARIPEERSEREQRERAIKEIERKEESEDPGEPREIDKIGGIIQLTLRVHDHIKNKTYVPSKKPQKM